MNHKEERKILVTGATGTVGSEVVKQLVSTSTDSGIKAAVHSKNRVDKIRQSINKDIEIVELDYTKQETIINALKDVDKLFLQTLPVPDVTDICSNIVKEAKKYGLNYIVKLSAMGAEPKSGSTILRLHEEEERIISESGISYTFLRPPAFMQNFITQFGQTIKTQNAFYVPAADSKMSFVDARDVAAIAVKMLMNSNNGEDKQYMNKGYDITGPEALTYSEVAEILSNDISKKISYIDITEDLQERG